MRPIGLKKHASDAVGYRTGSMPAVEGLYGERVGPLGIFRLRFLENSEGSGFVRVQRSVFGDPDHGEDFGEMWSETAYGNGLA